MASQSNNQNLPDGVLHELHCIYGLFKDKQITLFFTKDAVLPLVHSKKASHLGDWTYGLLAASGIGLAIGLVAREVVRSQTQKAVDKQMQKTSNSLDLIKEAVGDKAISYHNINTITFQLEAERFVKGDPCLAISITEENGESHGPWLTDYSPTNMEDIQADLNSWVDNICSSINFKLPSTIEIIE